MVNSARILAAASIFAVLTISSASALEGTEDQGIVLLARKVVTGSFEGDGVINNGAVVIRGGLIEAVGPRAEIGIPDGYRVEDLGDLWITPGMIDLHCHVAMGMQDLSESAFLTNPGMRASVGVIPGNTNLLNAVAGGVTSVLHIPGSATNMGGQGVLLRTDPAKYEDALIRDPGSLKLAQAGNPERRAPWNPRRSFMNYNTRNTFRRGVAYAMRWAAFEGGTGEKPERDLQFDIFRSLYKGEAQVSTHTQIYQVVLMTLTMVAENFKLPVYIDHGTFDGWRAAAKAQELGVHAILGPRGITMGMNSPGFASYDQDGAVFGVAAQYQNLGHQRVGFNTDCVGPLGRGIAQEELGLQASMGVRYGFDNTQPYGIRGVTSVPAEAAGLDDRLGRVHPGLEADLVISTGDPTDPRCSVERVYQAGRLVYNTATQERRF
ncbi:MAG: hypothetical protein OSB57_12825 [Planctomycetota bacterium]|nr:hypothetical protein [Planctomycetota bacterium]